MSRRLITGMGRPGRLSQLAAITNLSIEAYRWLTIDEDVVLYPFIAPPLMKAAQQTRRKMISLFTILLAWSSRQMPIVLS